MNRAKFHRIWLVLLCAASNANAQHDVSTLFSKEADVFASGEGLHVLELPADVIGACRQDLADIRVFDTRGAEVPYAVLRGIPLPAARPATPQRAKVLEARRETSNTDASPPMQDERYELQTAATRAPQVLALEVSSQDFARNIDITFLPDEGSPVPLVRGSTLFRLPHTGTKLRLPLGVLGKGRLVVALRGQGQGFLDPAFQWESEPAVEARSGLSIDMKVVSTRRQDGKTILEVMRPPGVAVQSLRLTTDTRVFDRAIRVLDAGPHETLGEIGRGRVARADSLNTPPQLEVGLRDAHGDRLRVEIEDGDSPPLAALAFAATLDRPALVLDLRGSTEAVAVLRFGGGRVTPPRYDIDSLLQRPRGDVEPKAMVEYATRLADLPIARIGLTRDNPSFQPAPTLRSALRPGQPIATNGYTHRRAVIVPESRDGVTRLVLAAEDLAVARPDLADVRIVDAQNRQIAFFLHSDEEDGWVPLEPNITTAGDGASTISLTPAVRPITAEAVEIDVADAFFNRPYALFGVDGEDHEGLLDSGRFAREADADASPLVVSFSRRRTHAFRLAITDDDDAPLRLTTARARLSLPVAFFVADPGPYWLLVGQADARPPSYDIATARSMILALESAVAEAGPLESNPSREASFRLAALRRPGPELDPGPYRQRRSVAIPESPDGLTRIELGAADIAGMRPDLADVRVIDEHRRQRAHLLVDGARHEAVDCRFGAPKIAGGRSTHTFRLPYHPVPVDALALESAVRYFDRSYVLRGVDAEGDPHDLASGRLVRSADGPPKPIVLSFSRTNLEHVEVVIEDGEDAPVIFTSARAEVPVPNLYVVAEPGQYTLLLDHPDAKTPEYDLARARATILSVESRPASLGSLEPNSEFSRPSRLDAADQRQVLMWIVLALALVLLTFFTLRLAGRPAPAPNDDHSD